ncbi:hypothetical protein [Pelotomaculum propionicicum]|uniref:hypothetical protein n=1 Tax=Pelotomaculum propionicicum TaxID=258475 RepID=UPI003BA38C71
MMRTGGIRIAAAYQRKPTRHRPMRESSSRRPFFPFVTAVMTIPAMLGPASIDRNISIASVNCRVSPRKNFGAAARLMLAQEIV